MSLLQNPDEYFSKPLTVYPMANLTRQTPEPPAAGEFTSNDIKPGPFPEHDLRMQWNAQADKFNQWDSLDSCEQLALAQTAAIAADRARRPQAEQMVEALRRLRRWGGHLGWDAQVVDDLDDWIDAGMTATLPPLPDHIARREVQF